MILMKNRYLVPGIYLNFICKKKKGINVTLWSSIIGRLSAYKLGLRWLESGCHREKNLIPIKNRYDIVYIFNKNRSGGGARNQRKAGPFRK